MFTLLQSRAKTVDYILDTVSAKHPIMDYLNLLKPDGKLVMVGIPPDMIEYHASAVVMGRKTIAGSLIGGIKVRPHSVRFLFRLSYCFFKKQV